MATRVFQDNNELAARNRLAESPLHRLRGQDTSGSGVYIEEPIVYGNTAKFPELTNEQDETPGREAAAVCDDSTIVDIVEKRIKLAEKTILEEHFKEVAKCLF